LFILNSFAAVRLIVSIIAENQPQTYTNKHNFLIHLIREIRQIRLHIGWFTPYSGQACGAINFLKELQSNF
jgi:hypothetical protein